MAWSEHDIKGISVRQLAQSRCQAQKRRSNFGTTFESCFALNNAAFRLKPVSDGRLSLPAFVSLA